MTIHDVALTVFAHLVAKDNTGGAFNESARDAVATAAYKYAEAFMKAQDDYDTSNPSAAKVEPLRL